MWAVRDERAHLPFTLVVPVYNEGHRLDQYAGELLDYATRLPWGSRLVFVDDGSTDDTAERLDKLIANSGASATVARRAHAGKGAAVRAGLLHAETEVAGFCDLDLSTPLSSFDRVRRAAERAPVVAIGSRDAMGSSISRSQSAVRELLGRTYNRAVQLAFTPGVVDTQCGAKAARRDVWRTVLEWSVEDGFAWDVEVVAIARAIGVPVQEVAIDWAHHDGTKIHVARDGTRMLVALGRIGHQVGSARTTAATAVAPSVEAPEVGTTAEYGVFTDRNAEALAAADVTHWWFRSKAALVTSVLRRAEPPRGPLVDLGAGSGGVTAALGWPLEESIVVEGSEALVDVARTRYALGAARGELNAVPVAGARASVVCLLDVIEHLRDPQPALREAHRLLGSDGVLAVTVPAHPRLWSAADDALGHVRRYTRRTLTAELERAGFSVELCTHVFSWLFVPVWVRRRVRSTGRAELGLDVASPVVDRAALVLTAVERVLVSRLGVRLPFGTSVLAVARPDGSAA
ncbi:MAG TPA: bifunctional glycosyltransferase/class I SAM-dependent methyltransferase [Acidimicrobiia bacterium]